MNAKLSSLNLLCCIMLLNVAEAHLAYGQGQQVNPLTKTDDLEITDAGIRYMEDLDLLAFELDVQGTAGNTVPRAKGSMDGAPVLGYVFPTNLSSTDVGFSETEGVVALAVTSHPDFDDTPLWDENSDRDYENDGVVFHTHWVVLVPDERVPGNLAVQEFRKEDTSVVLPPTNPGLPMYMDSPGHAVVLRGKTLRVLVPAFRVNNRTDFNFDAVTAYMELNTSDESRPMLGVYEVYNILSGDLSLPYSVSR